VLKREAPPDPTGAGDMAPRQYALLGLNEINLGHAGTFPDDHPIHRHLDALVPGDRLRMVTVQDGITLSTDRGFYVARLSQEGCRQWEGRLGEIAECRVLGLLYRFAEEGQPEFHRYLKVPFWQVPLLEIVIGD
jgi:ATP-dependent DNA helicase RecQ